MRFTAPLLLSALLGVATGCTPELRNGHYGCTQAADCPTGWSCWSDGRCYDQSPPSPSDGAVLDLGPAMDGSTRDATSGDRGEHDPDGATPNDASPGDGSSVEDASDDAGEDAGDLGFADGGACDPRQGQACDRPGACGGSYDCAGDCVGGTAEPSCSCGAPLCSNGTWGPCPGPSNVGADCSGGSVCHGAIACDGTCQGGSPLPSCPCGSATCEASGWVCPNAPANLNQPCDTATRCDGRIACDGSCQGGVPLPTCQCGTPTCGGCVGGTCGANSVCTNGACTCTVDACDCGVAGATCTLCGGSGNLEICAVDPYGCGASTTAQVCNFGCSGNTLTCNCSPNQGQYCAAALCTCDCGDFDRPGQVNCTGGCTPTATCFSVCNSECPLCDPRNPAC